MTKTQLMSTVTTIVWLLFCRVGANGKEICGGRNHEMIYSRLVSKNEPQTKAAEKWDQAMPTGNGRAGVLVLGNIQNETIILNHDSLFFTSRKPTLPDVSEHLVKLRKLVEQGRY